ncbi:MAG: DUF370 domain-containing protein [Clostridia bacterium]|nr:DUF370 domain-containing protein [Clostridia bacterium]
MIYLRLYNGYLIREEDIVGIFDLDSATEALASRKFLRESEARGRVRVASRSIPRSFIVTKDAVYLSHSSKSALFKTLTEV